MLNICKARKAQRELAELRLSETSGQVPEAYRPDETCTHNELAQMPARQLADGGRLKRTAQTQHARKTMPRHSIPCLQRCLPPRARKAGGAFPPLPSTPARHTGSTPLPPPPATQSPSPLIAQQERTNLQHNII